MSAASLAALLWVFAPPPPPPDADGGEVEDAALDPDSDPDADADADPADEPGAEGEPDEDPGAEDEPAADQPEELPLDERYDPILPYGEAEDGAELEYADEAPPPPELEYADETPPPTELDYDQSRERPVPEEAALARESDQQDDLGEDQFEGRVESPQRFALEVKFGPYLPDVDRNYGGSGFGPYATIFGQTDDTGATVGQPKKALYTVFSFEWQFVHFGGPFSVGTTVGVFTDRADALIADETLATDGLRSTADRVRFNIVPVTLLLGYRFELLADRFRVPLVPYARGGVAYGFWWERKGGTYAVDSAGNKARGGSWGWQVNLGLMLRLDFLERAVAVDLDRLTGINHTYLFGEWQFSRLDAFGSATAMSVGDDTFLLGLAVEF